MSPTAAKPLLVNHLPLARVEKFRTHGAIGSGFLQAYVDDAWVDVARYSNTLAARFHLLADKLEDLRKSGEVTFLPEEQKDTTHCPKCGLQADRGRRVVPALPAQECDRESAVAAHAAPVADGAGDVPA